MTLPTRRAGKSPRWDPFREFEELYDRLGWLLQSAVPGGGGLSASNTWAPPADVEETEDAYLVEVDLPGVSKDQVTVEVNDELVVHGEVQEKERTGVLHRQARKSGRFDYRISLPSGIDAEGVTAELTGGVLTVRVPKTGKAKPHRIEISG